MAIDYAVEYPCVPRDQLGTEGILDRLKAAERAQSVIRLFREAGDQRPPSEMGFEMVRSQPDGGEETRVVVVQEMLDLADELAPFREYCIGCPANISGAPFGCSGQIAYPISSQAEAWLLDQLPSIEQPIVWLLLREGVSANGYTGDTARSLRVNPSYFEERRVRGRDMGEFTMSSDQIFEMLFMVGSITPSHAGILLLLFGAIPRDVEAPSVVAIMNGALSSEQIAEEFPFILQDSPDDDTTIRDLKRFFLALHTAWRLNQRLYLDA